MLRFIEPAEIADARVLLRKFESIDYSSSNTEAHWRGLDDFKRGFDLLSSTRWVGTQEFELASNIRASHIRLLLSKIGEVATTASSSAFFSLLFANALISSEEREVVLSSNPNAAIQLEAFKELRRDELDQLVRSIK